MKVHIYNTKSFVPLFNGREIFWLVMMPLGGGRAIITLWAADRDHGKWLAVTSFLSFHSAGGGTWAMAGCYDDVQDLLTSVNDPDKHIRRGYVGRPDVIWQSSGCEICECRVLLPEEVRIGEASHVYSWGNPDRGNPDENTCHVSSGNVCHVASGGRSPYNHVSKLID